MSYVMLGSDAKKQQLSLAKQQAAQRQQQRQQQVPQQPVEQPTPFQPAPPSSGTSFFDTLMSAQNMPFVIGGGALLVGGIAYAIWRRKKA